ncbi:MULTISPECIES: hypothetical protein [Enterobacter cloacae complex]|uniref:hypothetical protein n=1 Tax=Enterobacter cloacae complex TaxID=354276 RepID=UPI000BA0DA61|nr:MULTISPECIES: hypothetical protein [Enterobacter cloacae complex]QBB06671.1 hypothetical protein EVV94_17615 [Enterobacter cloacae]AYL07856.1 hypothetical protein D9T11_25085 [Enterobacter kobei]MCE1345324.1 hypothetical protein [Enterobacter asburiae]MCH4289357.1 hypothetical protein [Enterobacter kobei]MDD9220199.1 hypothetical protein [Enterobacter kobei]
MRKTIGLIAILLASLSTTATAADNVYVKLSCENNTTVDITLKKQEEIGWADLSTPNGTRRASFLLGGGNDEVGHSLTFSSLGIAFNVDYTADKKFTLKMISGGSGEYACKVM